MDTKQKLKQLDLCCKHLNVVDNQIFKLEAKYPIFIGENLNIKECLEIEKRFYKIKEEQMETLKNIRSMILKKIYNLSGWKL